MWFPLRRVLIATSLLATANPVSAQQFDIVGTRAAGMGGAFVAVADDASATYWNPGGLALGHMFSLLVDRKVADLEAETLDDPSRHDRASLVTLGTPAFGFAHYQLRTASVTPAGTMLFRFPQGGETPVRVVRLDKLTAYHTGLTLVQSLYQGIAVGTTLKVVHGDIASSIVPEGNRDERLDDAAGLTTEGTDKFDADIGVMAGGGRLKVGFTIRNLTEPSFTITGTSDTLRLKRQMRTGVAVSVADGWSIASDFDLTENGPPETPVRAFAAGTEGRLTRQIFVRSGFHLNTTGKARPSLSAGGSYAVRSAVFIDGQATWGGENAERGWGIATRVVY
ncbi:MAG TPA: conjugal transfer protein TraF [Vicinamibacterales bacterium]|jgi:F plasmid transfer operon protein TraF|nr:conjugal transfer protein TraF [Vicinamibacterales bacterium]